MTCAEHLAGGPLVCQRTDPHAAGHVYHSTSGVPDRHDNPQENDS